MFACKANSQTIGNINAPGRVRRPLSKMYLYGSLPEKALSAWL